jgi:hypothetical protein
MNTTELRSHVIGGIMLVTGTPPGTLEPLLSKTLSEVDPNLTITSVRTMQQQIELSFDQERAVASLAGLFGVVVSCWPRWGSTASRLTRSRSEPTKSAFVWYWVPMVELVLQGAFKRVVIGLILGLPLAIGAGRLISAQLELRSARADRGGECARHLRILRRHGPGYSRNIDFARDRPEGGVAEVEFGPGKPPAGNWPPARRDPRVDHHTSKPGGSGTRNKSRWAAVPNLGGHLVV